MMPAATTPHSPASAPAQALRPKLLLPEAEVRCYQPALAQALGSDDEALVLQQLHYRLRTSSQVLDGEPWYKASYGTWQQRDFPRWSVASLQRVLTALEAKGLVVSHRLARHAYDRTKYYTIDYEALADLLAGPSSHIAMMDVSGLGPSIAANCDDLSEDPEEHAKEEQPPADFSLSPGEEDAETAAASEPLPLPQISQDTTAAAHSAPHTPRKAAKNGPVVLTYHDAWVLCQGLPEGPQAAIRQEAEREVGPALLARIPTLKTPVRDAMCRILAHQCGWVLAREDQLPGTEDSPHAP